jgi:hypothetical protein
LKILPIYRAKDAAMMRLSTGYVLVIICRALYHEAQNEP